MIANMLTDIHLPPIVGPLPFTRLRKKNSSVKFDELFIQLKSKIIFKMKYMFHPVYLEQFVDLKLLNIER
ncbi:hypothetical protein COI52_26155 [Bacillus toyonensis]